MLAISSRRQFLALLKKHDRFVVCGHVGPDGDVIGSTIALALGLKSLKKKVVAFNNDGCPEFLKFLPKSSMVVDALPQGDDWILITVDSGSLDRLGEKVLQHKFLQIWNIDHHASNRRFGDSNFIDLRAGSTGQVVYDLLSACRGFKISKDMATSIYCTLSTDTGSFKYSNATSDVFSLAAKMVKAGAKPDLISENLYNISSRARVALMTRILPSIRFEHEGQIAKVFVSLTDLVAVGATKEDFEGFENIPRGVPGVKVVCLFKEKRQGEWGLSLRSRDNVDVLKIALRFGGGGHKLAAGATVKGELTEIENEFERALSELGYV